MRKSSLEMWLRLPETKEYLERLKGGLDQILEVTLDRGMLRNANVTMEYARLIGMSDGIKFAVDFDALIDEGEE